MIGPRERTVLEAGLAIRANKCGSNFRVMEQRFKEAKAIKARLEALEQALSEPMPDDL